MEGRFYSNGLEVKTRKVYRHFKGQHYYVCDIATHSETDEQLVVYRALYGEQRLFVRPISMFFDEVDRTKYPDVEEGTRRFTEVTNEENKF